MINCSLGGIAPMLRGKVGKPIVVPKRTGDNIGDARRAVDVAEEDGEGRREAEERPLRPTRGQRTGHRESR